nr:DUF2165 domain-containing protein [Pseudomonas sp.]
MSETATLPMLRIAKTLAVMSIAFFATLAAFGNITDYRTNFAFVQHVMAMDTVFPDADVRYRAVTSPILHHFAYVLIIAVETLVAALCWLGGVRMASRVRAEAILFNRSKNAAIVGLTLGYLLWQVGFMSVGGEWFGMWMSSQWNGLESAFRFFITILGVLIFVALRDD